MEPLDELEALDKQALKQQYIASYHYTPTQRMVAGVFVVAIIIGLVIGGAYLFLSVINAFVK